MNIEFYRKNELPIAVIDNFYTENELKLIYEELYFLNNNLLKMYRPGETGSAEDENGNYLKNNIGISLDNTYNDRSISNILTLNRKLFHPDLIEVLCRNHVFFKYLEISTKDRTKVHYYENGSYYHKHTDGFVITATSWFYKTPKKFFGGDLLFDEIVIECLENRIVIFPSILDHEVSEVKMNFEDNYKKNGRYCITQFALI